jgi:hypothetical protein
VSDLDLTQTSGDSRAARRRGAREPVPPPVQLRTRVFPIIKPYRLHLPGDSGDKVIIAETALTDGRAESGVYLGDGPGLEQVGGRFLGRDPSPGFDPPGAGPLREIDNFLDRVLWRPVYESRFGLVSWNLVTLFSSLALRFKKAGRWAILWTYIDADGSRLVDLHRSPIVFEPRANGRVRVTFGPRKHPDPRDYGPNGRQYEGRFLALQDAASALAGERIEELPTACRLFGVDPPPARPATPESLPARVHAMRGLYRAVRAEAEIWPGVSLWP